MCVRVGSWLEIMPRGLAFSEVEKVEIKGRIGAGEQPSHIAEAVKRRKTLIWSNLRDIISYQSKRGSGRPRALSKLDKRCTNLSLQCSNVSVCKPIVSSRVKLSQIPV